MVRKRAVRYLFLFLLLMGVLFVGIIIHEFVHVWMADEVVKVCMEFGSRSIFTVHGYFPQGVHPFFTGEGFAHTVEFLFVLIGSVIIIKLWKEYII